MNNQNIGEQKSKLKVLPGSVIYTGTSQLETTISHYSYRNNQLNVNDDLYEYDDSLVDWISIEGFKNIDVITDFCEKIGVDILLVEDIFNITQRNKFIYTKDHLFAILKYPIIEKDSITFRTISFVLRKDSIVSFTDYKNPYVQNILDRINNSESQISRQKEDYLLYVIYDIIIDEHFDMAKKLAAKLQEEETTILDLKKSTSQNLYTVYKNMVLLRNNVKSFKENIYPSHLLKTDFVCNEIEKYLLDLEDHINNLLEKTNTYIDVSNSLISMYSNQLSNKTNEIMKILTIMSVVFIPLSFFAGFFGMNFIHFDFLQSTYGVLIFSLASVALVGLMLLYFKYKKWL